MIDQIANLARKIEERGGGVCWLCHSLVFKCLHTYIQSRVHGDIYDSGYHDEFGFDDVYIQVIQSTASKCEILQKVVQSR